MVLLIFRIVLNGLPLHAASAPPEQTSLEHKVKAAYLLNFTRYIDWPNSAFETPDSPIQICILGADPFGATLEKTVAGRSSKGRRIEVRRQSQIDDRLLSCHLVFLSQSESGQEGALLEQLKDHPVLTVGEFEDFLSFGGMINFTIAGDNVHFEVNAGAAERAGLKVSSRILPLASRVMDGGTAK